MAAFRDVEYGYLRHQRLGRLATIGPDGGPQVRPVGFFPDREAGTIDIGGHDLVRTQKWRNVARNPQVAFVVDDLASIDPWRPRGVEVRGRAELLPGVGAPAPGVGDDRIRIHVDRVLAWGLDRDPFAMHVHG